MSPTLIGFLILFWLLLTGFPIGISMLLVGFAGFGLLVDWQPALAMVGQTIVKSVTSYHFSVVPMFLLMGNFIVKSGFAQDLYRCAHTFLGHLRGGLAMSTVIACGGFGSVCGSGVATVATMTQVSVPPMRQFGYSDSLAIASVCAGGTLGILIPPSIPLVIYGLITESDIGKLFVAAIVPGLIGIVGYLIAIQLFVYFKPQAGPPAERSSWQERIAALKRVWGVLALFVLIMGGIYTGIFTPTEAASFGALGAFLLAVMRKSLSWTGFIAVVSDAMRTTVIMFVILIGAMIFANFVTVANLPAMLRDFVASIGVSPLMVILAIGLIYMVLGCFLESMAMMLITVPVLFPLVLDAGLDPIWFGIFTVVATELSMITPPLGLNLFVVKSIVPDVTFRRIYVGLIPFIFMDILRLVLIALVPTLTLWLVTFM